MKISLHIFLFFSLFAFMQNGFAQCKAQPTHALSARTSNYSIKLNLDDVGKKIAATQTLTFRNDTPEPIRVLRFYMYFNAFKNTESTFLKGVTSIFGQSYTENRTADEWGWIDVQQISRKTANGSTDLSAGKHYTQLDDANKSDQSVLEVPLDKPILSGETAVFGLKWHAKIPKTIARAGYSKDFYLLCHWFPQLGVFEQNALGKWDWNCHQFYRNNEFYADFGNYDVEITAADKFVMGASGCLVSETKNKNGSTTRRFQADDVIDFAWSIYPDFTVQTDRWKDTEIRLLIPQEHAYLGKRYISAIKFALNYFEQHVAAYPYPSITIIDPPFHGLRSGLMEYPTLVTVGTFYGTPQNIRLMESLVVHEFAHQFFMEMVASNEKEEPWLDEGFVTYFEDRIIDAQFGRKHALADLWGFRLDNRELTRTEYTRMQNPREGAPARPGWAFTESNFKALIYSKTATTLHTLEGLLGTPKMDDLIQTYFRKWQFKHPKGSDFVAVLKEKMAMEKDTAFAKNVVDLFQKSIYGASVLDYAVRNIKNEVLPAPQGMFGANADSLLYKNGSETPKNRATVELARNGDWVFPVELLVRFDDGSTETKYWSGVEGQKIFEFYGKAKIVSAQIDPQHKLALDLDLNNNSMTLQSETVALWKYAAKTIFWVQNLFQTISFLS